MNVYRRVRQGELPEGQEKVPWGTTSAHRAIRLALNKNEKMENALPRGSFSIPNELISTNIFYIFHNIVSAFFISSFPSVKTFCATDIKLHSVSVKYISVFPVLEPLNKFSPKRF